MYKEMLILGYLGNYTIREAFHDRFWNGYWWI